MKIRKLNFFFIFLLGALILLLNQNSVRAYIPPTDGNTNDPYEFNDTFSYATYISLSQSYDTFSTTKSYGDVDSSGDVDYFYFNLIYASKITIYLYNIPSGNDYDLKLYNSSQNQIGYSVNGSNNSEKIVKDLQPGKYYIKVYSYSGYSNTNYTLKVSGIQEPRPDSYESNNTFSSSTLLSSNNNAIYANIHAYDDVDYYKIEVSDLKYANVTINLSNIPVDTNYDFTLYSYNYSELATENNGQNYSENITLELYPGTYYIKVFPEMSLKGFSNQNYSLSVVLDYTKDKYEDNDEFSSAYDITNKIGNEIYANLHEYGEKDYYKFSVSTTKNITIELSNIPQIDYTAKKQNYDILIYDKNYSLINSNTTIVSDMLVKYDYDKGDLTSSFKSIIVTLNPGTYYIKVYSPLNHYSDDLYKLKMIINDEVLKDQYEGTSGNDTWINATNINIADDLIRDEITGNAHVANDYDYYKFDVIDNEKNIHISLKTLPLITGDPLYDVELYKEDYNTYTISLVENYIKDNEEGIITINGSIGLGRYYIKIIPQNKLSISKYKLVVNTEFSEEVINFSDYAGAIWDYDSDVSKDNYLHVHYSESAYDKVESIIYFNYNEKVYDDIEMALGFYQAVYQYELNARIKGLAENFFDAKLDMFRSNGCEKILDGINYSTAFCNALNSSINYLESYYDNSDYESTHTLEQLFVDLGYAIGSQIFDYYGVSYYLKAIEVMIWVSETTNLNELINDMDELISYVQNAKTNHERIQLTFYGLYSYNNIQVNNFTTQTTRNLLSNDQILGRVDRLDEHEIMNELYRIFSYVDGSRGDIYINSNEILYDTDNNIDFYNNFNIYSNNLEYIGIYETGFPQ